MTISTVAGGLFGIPIGAVAGWYIGDQMAREDRAQAVRMQENEDEIQRLRDENRKLRNQLEEH